ncbi:hypothetical protein KR009_006232, partial [Drosophila setifemur]
MFRKQASILVLCLFLGTCLARKLHAPVRPNSHIQELQEESRELAATNAATSANCFTTYNPRLQQSVVRFENDFGACIATYDNASALIIGKYKKTRDEILLTASNSCNACCLAAPAQDSLGAMVKQFECASDVSAMNSKIFYAISANATETSVQIQQDLATVVSQKELCVETANRIYVEDTATSYENLNACLKGNIVNFPTSVAPYTTTRGYYDTTPGHH